MQVRQLLTFVTVARTGNMAQAAEVLNYSHSSVYGHLEALEKEFNVKLYERVSHGIVLTENGRKFLPYAKQFVDLYFEISDTLSNKKQNIIRIASSESGDVCIMHELLSHYIENTEPIEVEYIKMTTDTAISKLTAGACDVAVICEFDLHNDDIYYQYLVTIPLVFVASPTLIATMGKNDSLPKLLGTMKMSVAVKMLESVGLEFKDWFSVLTNIGDLATIRHLVSLSNGIALLPEIYVREDIQKGLLARIPALMGTVDLNCYIATPSENRVGKHTKEFIELSFAKFNPNHLKEGVELSF